MIVGVVEGDKHKACGLAKIHDHGSDLRWYSKSISGNLSSWLEFAWLTWLLDKLLTDLSLTLNLFRVTVISVLLWFVILSQVPTFVTTFGEWNQWILLSFEISWFLYIKHSVRICWVNLDGNYPSPKKLKKKKERKDLEVGDLDWNYHKLIQAHWVSKGHFSLWIGYFYI